MEEISVLEAIILGAVQGLTEFLPVSSSGHLQIAKELLGVELTDNIAFDVMMHLATVLSTIVILWSAVRRVVTGFFSFRKGPDMTYALKIIFSMTLKRRSASLIKGRGLPIPDTKIACIP